MSSRVYFAFLGFVLFSACTQNQSDNQVVLRQFSHDRIAQSEKFFQLLKGIGGPSAARDGLSVDAYEKITFAIQLPFFCDSNFGTCENSSGLGINDILGVVIAQDSISGITLIGPTAFYGDGSGGSRGNIEKATLRLPPGSWQTHTVAIAGSAGSNLRFRRERDWMSYDPQVIQIETQFIEVRENLVDMSPTNTARLGGLYHQRGFPTSWITGETPFFSGPDNENLLSTGDSRGFKLTALSGSLSTRLDGTFRRWQDHLSECGLGPGYEACPDFSDIHGVTPSDNLDFKAIAGVFKYIVRHDNNIVKIMLHTDGDDKRFHLFVEDATGARVFTRINLRTISVLERLFAFAEDIGLYLQVSLSEAEIETEAPGKFVGRSPSFHPGLMNYIQSVVSLLVNPYSNVQLVLGEEWSFRDSLTAQDMADEAAIRMNFVFQNLWLPIIAGVHLPNMTNGSAYVLFLNQLLRNRQRGGHWSSLLTLISMQYHGSDSQDLMTRFINGISSLGYRSGDFSFDWGEFGTANQGFHMYGQSTDGYREWMRRHFFRSYFNQAHSAMLYQGYETGLSGDCRGDMQSTTFFDCDMGKHFVLTHMGPARKFLNEVMPKRHEFVMNNQWVSTVAGFQGNAQALQKGECELVFYIPRVATGVSPGSVTLPAGTWGSRVFDLETSIEVGPSEGISGGHYQQMLTPRQLSELSPEAPVYISFKNSDARCQ